MDIRLDPAGPDRAAELTEIKDKAFYADHLRYGFCPGYGVPTAETALRLGEPDRMAWRILDGDTPVGMAAVKRLAEGRYELACLCVLPERQGQGIGSAAMTFLDREIADAVVWELVTPADKEENLRFYRANGYETAREAEDHGVRLAVMERRRVPLPEGDRLDRLAASLTGEDVGILPFLPALLQDLWEMGSSPADMARLIRERIPPGEVKSVLDLGCGKGPVSVRLAEELGLRVRGIDLMEGFIAEARAKAREHGVAALCEFAVGDLAEVVRRERGWDCVVYGAVGAVLGGPEATLRALQPVLRPGGWLLLDDAYLHEADATPHTGSEWLTLADWKALFTACGYELVTWEEAEDGGAEAWEMIEPIARRADELSERYPQRRTLFEDYMRSQRAECEDLDDSLVGVTWLAKRTE